MVNMNVFSILAPTDLISGESLEMGETLNSPPHKHSRVVGRHRLTLQEDGNIVHESDDGWADPHWSAGTSCSGKCKLTMQEDNNLVLYDENGSALWSSGTHNVGQSGGFARLHNPDDVEVAGRFVIYDGAGDEIWRAPNAHEGQWAPAGGGR